jgi:hypothetical protein
MITGTYISVVMLQYLYSRCAEAPAAVEVPVQVPVQPGNDTTRQTRKLHGPHQLGVVSHFHAFISSSALTREVLFLKFL